MAKKRFDLGAYLQDAGVKNEHGDEQIVRIDLDLIVPDPNNFYSLDGIDELAANIETVGLLDALRVRPVDGKYMIVSGHRRRAAILLIRDGGSDMFRDGVPCIVEYGEASDAMRELRLIYANSSTRVMSSADLARQAERVTELLYQLKSQGVEFPGRMREHVAAACQVSEAKIARLHAIKKNLRDTFRLLFDSGRLPEGLAYRLSQEDDAVQQSLFEKMGVAVCSLSQDRLDACIGQAKRDLEKDDAEEDERAAEAGYDPGKDHTDAVVSEYLAQRAEEDRKYFEMLEAVADKFLTGLYKVNARHAAIDLLKQGYRNAGHWGLRGDVCWTGQGRGLELEISGDMSTRLLRSWTEVYDMLASIAINRCATMNREEED